MRNAAEARGHGDGIAPARWFNRNLDRATNGYAGAVGAFVRRPFRFLVVLLAFGAGAYMLYQKLPGSFLPSEDQGVLMVMVETPEGSTAERTRALVEEVEQYVLGTEKDTAESVFAALGFGFGGSGPRNAMIFVKLKDFELREGFDAASMATRGNLRFMENRNGQVFFMQPPAIQGMGNTAGFTMHLIDQSGHGQERWPQLPTNWWKRPRRMAASPACKAMTRHSRPRAGSTSTSRRRRPTACRSRT